MNQDGDGTNTGANGGSTSGADTANAGESAGEGTSGTSSRGDGAGSKSDTKTRKRPPAPRARADFGSKVNRIEKIFLGAQKHLDSIVTYETEQGIEARITGGIVEQGLGFVLQLRDGNSGKKLLANQFLADTTQEIIDRDGLLSFLTLARSRASTIMEHDVEFQKLMGRGQTWSVRLTGPLIDGAGTIVKACEPPAPGAPKDDPKNPTTNYGKCLKCGIVRFAPDLDAARKKLIASNARQQKTRSERVAKTADVSELMKTATKAANRVLRIVREIFKHQPTVLADFTDPNPKVGNGKAVKKGAKKKGTSRRSRRIQDALKKARHVKSQSTSASGTAKSKSKKARKPAKKSSRKTT